MFKGLYTALITPFKYGAFDEESFSKLVEWQIANGVHGLVPCGATGEATTLSREEHIRVIDACVRITKGRIPIIAGTGTSSTSDTIELSNLAKDLGVNGLMLITPHGNRPGQEGMFQHFKTIAENVDLPIILCNAPGRTAVDLTDETIIRLSKIDNIVGIKDTSGDLERILYLKQEVKSNFSLFCGDDPIALAFNTQGGIGCFSVAANVMPKLSAEIQNCWFNGNVQKAIEIRDLLIPLYSILFCETNPVPIKYAASLIDFCFSDVRLPLVPLSERSKKLVKDVMQDLNVRIKNYEELKEHCRAES